jgi:hypothetical protein
MKANLPTSSYKQRIPSSRRCEVSQVASQQETYLMQTHIHKTEATGNDAYQNTMATWMEVILSTSDKILIYEAILKPTWTYGIQFWGTASTSNTEILERFQTFCTWL